MRTIIEKRWWLVAGFSALTFIISYVVAALYCDSLWYPSRKVVVLALYTFVGPFAGLVAGWVPINESANWFFGVAGIALLLAHPAKPRALTAAISSIGFMLWLFMGIVWVYVKPS